MSSSKPASIGTSPKAAPCARIGFTELNTSAARDDPARRHLVQHPGGRDAALGGIQHQDFPHIGLARELVRRAREHAGDAIEIVARRKAVVRDERGPAHGATHGLAGAQHLHVSLNVPLCAASTQASIEAIIGR